MRARAEYPMIYNHQGEEVRARSTWPSTLQLGLWVGLLFAVSNEAFRWYKSYHPKTEVSAPALGGTATFTNGGSFYSGHPYLSDVAKAPSKEWEVALKQAFEAWTVALGQMPIQEPELILGTERSCISIGSPIACADLKRNAIVIAGIRACAEKKVKGSYECDKTSILMHELGHLLGVPHIEGDALMNSEYTEPVKSPSLFAVAIARVNLVSASTRDISLCGGGITPR